MLREAPSVASVAVPEEARRAGQSDAGTVTDKQSGIIDLDSEDNDLDDDTENNNQDDDSEDNDLNDDDNDNDVSP